MSIAQMVEWFDIRDVNKGAARFDFAKLEALNGIHMRQMDDRKLLDIFVATLPYLEKGADLAAKLDDAGKAYIARELSVAVGEVEAMEMRLQRGDQSLNATIAPSGEDAWQDFLADERPGPEEIVTGAHDSRQRSRWLAMSLAELSERERTIIHERRLREDGRTLEELGTRLGISKERVRQIEHRALQKLKVALLKRVQDPIEIDLFTAVPS